MYPSAISTGKAAGGSVRPIQIKKTQQRGIKLDSAPVKLCMITGITTKLLTVNLIGFSLFGDLLKD